MSSRRSGAVATALSVLFGVLLFTVSPASAQPPGDRPCRRDGSVSQSVAGPGEVIDFSGDGFEPSMNIDIFFDGQWVQAILADEDGSFSTQVRIPDDASDGEHTLTARGASSGGRNPYPPGQGGCPQDRDNTQESVAGVRITRSRGGGGGGGDGGPGTGGGPAVGGTGGGRGGPAVGGTRGDRVPSTGAAAVLPMLAIGFALVVVGSITAGASRHRRLAD